MKLVSSSGGVIGETTTQERNSYWTKLVSCSNGANAWIKAVGEACPDRIRDEAIIALPGCPRPPRLSGCKEAVSSCQECTGVGGGSGADGGGPGFGGKSGPPALGPGARMHYLAGGAGSPGNPGQAAWNAILGRNWSHDYAERIVTAPGGRAWLITAAGSFREFTDASNDGLYEKVLPENEYRVLTRTASGWSLRDLTGTVSTFDAAGLWTSTADRNGNTKTATYTAGRLTSVAMPDGRSERFSYHPSGKLAAITEVGIDGGTERTWSLTWAGDDLAAIEAPDGTGLRFVYGDDRLPGAMTRALLVGADDGDPNRPRPQRVESAWSYDGVGNVVRSWRGSPDFATGVERYEMAYDNPFEPARTTVTIHRSDTQREVVVYTLSRTAPGGKARVASTSGECSSCGLGPSSQLFYEDPANPQLPTRILDGSGTETWMSYDGHGRAVERTEAAGTPLSRTTPGLTTRPSRPCPPASRPPRPRAERHGGPPC